MSITVSKSSVFIVAFMLVTVIFVDCASSQGVSKPGTEKLPDDLFLLTAPANPLDVKVARTTAEPGKPITLRGRVGGAPAPLVENRAVFLITDIYLPTCHEGCHCPTPWDACCAPKEIVQANLAVVQVTDSAGKPLKIGLNGVNGLKPMAEVIIQGTTAKKDKTQLLVNAERIYVNKPLY